MNETKFAVRNYRGVTVSCSTEQWDFHIVSNHGIMRNNVGAVKDTIKNPDAVHKSDQNDNREVYFKDSPVSSYRMYTKVIVEYGEGAKNPNVTVGHVVTAFPAKERKGGIGDAVYPSSND